MGASVTSSGFGYGFGVAGGLTGSGSPRQGAFGAGPDAQKHAGMGMGMGQGARKGMTRPAKVLVYSSDGYTESSVLALCLLMAMRGMSLPQAYLELQVCFFFSSVISTGANSYRRRSPKSGASSSTKPISGSSNASKQNWPRTVRSSAVVPQLTFIVLSSLVTPPPDPGLDPTSSGARHPTRSRTLPSRSLPISPRTNKATTKVLRSPHHTRNIRCLRMRLLSMALVKLEMGWAG